MQYRIITVYVEDEKLWTNRVLGLERDLFIRRTTAEAAVTDGKVLAELFGIPYAAEETARRAAPQHKKVKPTRVAEFVEKVPCPETPGERKQLIERMFTANGGITAVSLAQLGMRWPPVKGWKEKLVAEGW